MPEDPRRRDPDYDDVIAEAVHHVSDTLAAQQEAEARQRPKSPVARLATAVAVLALVGAWNAWLIFRPAPVPDTEIWERGLRFEVGQLVMVVESYRDREGHLPEPADLGDLVDDVISYERTANGYVVRAHDGQVRLAYDGSIPIETWMAERGGGS